MLLFHLNYNIKCFERQRPKKTKQQASLHHPTQSSIPSHGLTIHWPHTHNQAHTLLWDPSYGTWAFLYGPHSTVSFVVMHWSTQGPRLQHQQHLGCGTFATRYTSSLLPQLWLTNREDLWQSESMNDKWWQHPYVARVAVEEIAWG